MKPIKLLGLACVFVTAGLLGACDTDGPAEEAGEAVDQAVEEAEEAGEEAREKIQGD